MDVRVVAGIVAFFVTGLVLIAYKRRPRNDSRLLNILYDINLKIDNMPTKAEYQALAQEMRDSFANIGDDITRLTDQLQKGDLTPEEEAEVFAEFRGLADQAKTIAGRTPEQGTEEPGEEEPNPES